MSEPAVSLVEVLVQERIAELPLQSLLEVTALANSAVKEVCEKYHVRYQRCSPASCSGLAQRFDLAIVHRVETLPLTEVRLCVGTLKNLLSERVWLVLEPEYGKDEEWISLGFKRDSLPRINQVEVASFSYNLETYNHKRDWNNTRFWANPENWDKRF